MVVFLLIGLVVDKFCPDLFLIWTVFVRLRLMSRLFFVFLGLILTYLYPKNLTLVDVPMQLFFLLVRRLATLAVTNDKMAKNLLLIR